ncbi:MAG: choice-of-anchor B family protein [Bacteroidetes bacterium]|nr:choice-of-anchor B family protein [Bacteroidota bacterium]
MRVSKLILIVTLIIGLNKKINSQTYPNQNISLVSFIDPHNNIGVGVDGRKYSGCWGWYQSSKNKEYAISGASNGIFFIDISSPITPSVSAFISGKAGCTWREIKTYQNYVYVASDDATPNNFLIADMQYLPDSVHIVHYGTEYFERGHTLWIDKDKLYVGSTTYTTGFSSMNVYSLATPTAPVLLRQLNQDYPFINHVHDMYARNDTVFASCGNQGLYIFKLLSNNTFTLLGSYSGYPNAGYNHSSFLTANGKNLVFCDEVPTGLPFHVVDVQNLTNIQSQSVNKAYQNTTPHNPYLIGNDYALISCYQDGLLIYNISNPATPTLTGFFDTHPQGGGNVGNYFGADYRGNWGAYPWLPSGLIIANDMQNGVFILKALAAFSNTTAVTLPNNTLSIKQQSNNNQFYFYPNPATNRIAIQFSNSELNQVSISTLLGKEILYTEFKNNISQYLDVSSLTTGNYFLTVKNKNGSLTKKLCIQN